uniref:Uncharacterized protein n=1 Tax=Anguilla anguilla TaxID=7936 RepID=A0A0E9TIC6_ANGAN
MFSDKPVLCIASTSLACFSLAYFYITFQHVADPPIQRD